MHLEPEPSHAPNDETRLAASTDEHTAAELLKLCDEFFRCHASPQVHAELSTFLTARGHHPTTSPDWFIDAVGFAALSASQRFLPSRGQNQ